LPVPDQSRDRPGSDAGDDEEHDSGTKRGVVIIAM
jgi:hypothetical protein